MAAHFVQIINKPHQIIPLEVWRTLPIFLPTEYAGKSILEPRRGPIEAVELLQGRRTGGWHGE